MLSSTGSTLANYTPKVGYADEQFQLGVTKTSTPLILPDTEKDQVDESTLIEEEPHIVFSAGTNADILF